MIFGKGNERSLKNDRKCLMTHNKVFEQRNNLNNSSCDILASIASEIKAFTENFIK